MYMQTYGRLTVIGFGPEHWKGVICQCSCGNFISVRPFSLKRGSSKSCGCLARELASEQMKARVGPLNPNFGKRGPEVWNFKGYNRRRPRNSDFRIWRRAVFERDDYTCQRNSCRIRGTTLNAHHIKAWPEFPEECYDVDNGITYSFGDGITPGPVSTKLYETLLEIQNGDLEDSFGWTKILD